MSRRPGTCTPWRRCTRRGLASHPELPRAFFTLGPHEHLALGAAVANAHLHDDGVRISPVHRGVDDVDERDAALAQVLDHFLAVGLAVIGDEQGRDHLAAPLLDPRVEPAHHFLSTLLLLRIRRLFFAATAGSEDGEAEQEACDTLHVLWTALYTIRRFGCGTMETFGGDMVRLLIGILVGAGVLAGCGDDDGSGGGTDAGPISMDAGPGHACRSDDDCTPGWTCGAGEMCTCAALVEDCDGRDDDCDGEVDEGRGPAIGCGDREACIDGACACAPESTCDGVCTDTSTNRRHCGACGNACDVTEGCVAGLCCEAQPLPVDVLFVMDNSGSMAEEQLSIAEQLPRMVRALTSGDVDADGVQDFPAAADLHLGVVTTDMGTASFTLPTCDNPMFGEDGVLRTQGDATDPACMATYPSFLEFDPMSGGTAEEAAAAFACVARAGTTGCGFEQQLEAGLKAVVPSTSGITFFADTTGHGDGANAGFVRADSVLAVILVTDEDDCSVSDPDIFNPSSTTYAGNLNLRCADYPEALHPISRYVEGFRALRAEQPERFVFAAITGVPPDLVADAERIDYDAILADERMTAVESSTSPGTLVPSCDVEGRGQAYPPRRIVETVRDLAPASVVQSICQEDFGPAMGAVIEGIAIPLGEACII